MRKPRTPDLPFADLPRDRALPRAPRSPVVKNPLPGQGDLLSWSPPRTHLGAEEAGLVLIAPEQFRPQSRETYLYHLTDTACAHHYAAQGLPLQDRLIFLTAIDMQSELQDVVAERDMMLVQVRQRFLRAWLCREDTGGRTCYVLSDSAR